MKLLNFLITEDKSRFIKNAPNLSSTEKTVLLDFFKKNRQAEKDIDWLKIKDLHYEDFEKVMAKYKSGRKTVLRHQSISGLKEGEDYIKLKLRRKDFLAYAVMTHEGSKVIASSRVGPCRGKWCVAHSESSNYWNEYAIDNDEVFVYVMNTDAKWAVEIDRDNHSYEVWDAEDRTGAVIPDFDIRDELLTPALKKVYDDIRSKYEREDEEIDVSEEIDEYEDFVYKIYKAVEDYSNARENFWNECQSIKSDTMAGIKEEIQELEDDLEKATIERDLRKRQGVLPGAGKFVNIDAEVTRLEKEIKEKQELIDKIDDILEYEMYTEDDIEWSDEPPNEEWIFDDVSFPSIYEHRYRNYRVLCENHFDASGKDFDDINEKIYKYIYNEGNSRKTVEEILSDNECYHPEIVNNR